MPRFRTSKRREQMWIRGHIQVGGSTYPTGPFFWQVDSSFQSIIYNQSENSAAICYRSLTVMGGHIQAGIMLPHATKVSPAQLVLPQGQLAVGVSNKPMVANDAQTDPSRFFCYVPLMPNVAATEGVYAWGMCDIRSKRVCKQGDSIQPVLTNLSVNPSTAWKLPAGAVLGQMSLLVRL